MGRTDSYAEYILVVDCRGESGEAEDFQKLGEMLQRRSQGARLAVELGAPNGNGHSFDSLLQPHPRAVGIVSRRDVPV